MTAPQYQEFAPDRIPVAEPAAGVRVKVIAGQVGEIEGPVKQPATDPLYLDILLEAGASFEQAVPEGHTAFAYAYEGAVDVAGENEPAMKGDLLVFGRSGAVRFTARSASRLILVAGRPLREPVARYGPFVMNTREELVQAVEDLRAGRF